MSSTSRATRLTSKERLEAVTEKILRILKVGNSRAEVFLLNGQEMSNLKKLTTGKSPHFDPDVLSFENPSGFPHPEGKGMFLGEIYVNSSIARRDLNRATFLALHGLLHLLGYSHLKKDDTLKMERLERELLEKIISK